MHGEDDGTGVKHVHRREGEGEGKAMTAGEKDRSCLLCRGRRGGEESCLLCRRDVISVSLFQPDHRGGGSAVAGLAGKNHLAGASVPTTGERRHEHEFWTSRSQWTESF